MKRQRETSPRRRAFLHAVAASGGALGATALAGAAGAEEARDRGQTGADASREGSYRLTAHIETYYRKARM